MRDSKNVKFKLEEKNLIFEQIRSSDQALQFDYLEKVLQNQLNIEAISLDILKTLQLYSDSTGYNNAAALLADHNNFPGIDSVKIGKRLIYYRIEKHSQTFPFSNNLI